MHSFTFWKIVLGKSLCHSCAQALCLILLWFSFRCKMPLLWIACIPRATVQSIKFFLMLHNMGVHYFFSHLRVSNNTRKTHQPDFARLQLNEDLEKFPCLARSLVANYLLTNQQPLKWFERRFLSCVRGSESPLWRGKKFEEDPRAAGQAQCFSETNLLKSLWMSSPWRWHKVLGVFEMLR